MEEPTKHTLFTTLREAVVDLAIGAFFGFYGAYWWLSSEDAKQTLVDGFGIKFFAITKAVILLASIASGVLGGYRLFRILWKYRGSFKFVPPPEEKKTR